MEERRKVEQRKIYGDDGRLQYTIIPNYKKTEHFMTENEIRFYKILILIVQEIREKYNIRLEVFTQVAINRIIEQNNKREKELEKHLFAKIIDFVLYDKDKDEIFCCIELDGIEHKIDKERILRDKIINEAFEGNVKLIRQEIQKNYNKQEIINKIMMN